MSKLTFRADDDLVARLEEFDASKSEVLREALREYIERHANRGQSVGTANSRLDDLLADRIDSHLDERLTGTRDTRDVAVNITLARPASGQVSDGVPTAAVDGVDVNVSRDASHGAPERNTPGEDGANTDSQEHGTCTQCGGILSPSHVYCPNCGEKNSHRVFCDCGDELRSDWAFCPGCGRRTSAADVLDSS
jgi:Arc/MetJ-type ribon-helix-helix transcriptional regulator